MLCQVPGTRARLQHVGLLADDRADVELQQRPRDELRLGVTAGGVLALRRVVVREAVERHLGGAQAERQVPDRRQVEVDVVALLHAEVPVVVPLLPELRRDVDEALADAELEVRPEVERALRRGVVDVLGLEVHPGLDVDVAEGPQRDHRPAGHPVDAESGAEDAVEPDGPVAPVRRGLDLARLLDHDVDQVVPVLPGVDVLELDRVARDVRAVRLRRRRDEGVAVVRDRRRTSPCRRRTWAA